MGVVGHSGDLSAPSDTRSAAAVDGTGQSAAIAFDGRGVAVDGPAESAAEAKTRQGATRYPTLAVAGLVLAVVVLWAGYTRRWPWTGINGHTATLWDWLHLMLLPVVLAVLPVWLSRRAHLRPVHKKAGFTIFGLFVLLVVIGYMAPWGWTGFTGNKMWDWLELLALPLAVSLAPLCADLRDCWTVRHTLTATALLALFLVPVLGGYLGHWGWTGFEGNTLWDWLNLFLLPLLIPTVVAPAIKAIATAGVLEAETAAAKQAAEAVAARAEAAEAVAAEAIVGVAGGRAERRTEPPPTVEPGRRTAVAPTKR